MRPWLQLQTKVLNRGSSFLAIVNVLGAITRTNLMLWSLKRGLKLLFLKPGSRDWIVKFFYPFLVNFLVCFQLFCWPSAEVLCLIITFVSGAPLLPIIVFSTHSLISFCLVNSMYCFAFKPHFCTLVLIYEHCRVGCFCFLQIVLFKVLGGWLLCAVVCYWMANSATSCIWWLRWGFVEMYPTFNYNVFRLLFEWLKMYIFTFKFFYIMLKLIVVSFLFDMIVDSEVDYQWSFTLCLSCEFFLCPYNWHGKEARWTPPNQRY